MYRSFRYNKNENDVLLFIGIVGYYRTHVPYFAQIRTIVSINVHLLPYIRELFFFKAKPISCVFENDPQQLCSTVSHGCCKQKQE